MERHRRETTTYASTRGDDAADSADSLAFGDKKSETEFYTGYAGPAGSYKAWLSAEKQKMASGVYFYSVDADEGHLQGRVVILK